MVRVCNARYCQSLGDQLCADNFNMAEACATEMPTGATAMM
jgi:hypothetical protein